MNKSPITDRLDTIIRESEKIIDNYQMYERGLAKLMAFIRNYINEKFIQKKLDEILVIKKQFEIVMSDFKNIKNENHKEFDTLMLEYLNKIDEYFTTVISSMDKRINLQNVLLTQKGTLSENISLNRDIENAVHICLQATLEVNKIIVKMQHNTQ
jgi:hypothetical protein